jgi:DNA-binding MarR family transcriptional regulator
MRDPIDGMMEDWKRERPDLDAADAGVIGRLLMLGRQLERIGVAELKPFGLGVTDHDVLANLRRRGPTYSASPGELLGELVLTSGSLTSCFKRLEQRDLVRRRKGGPDGRSRVVELTDAGCELIDRALEARFDASSRLLHSMTRTEKRELDRLAKIVQGNGAREF